MTNHGTAVNRTHGRNLPQRVLVRSARMPDNRVGHRVPQPRPEQDGGGGAGAQTENVRVKIGLEQDHRHEDEVRRGVGGAVTGLLEERKFLLVVFGFGHAVLGRNHFTTVKIIFCKSLSREELPAMISNSPGSTVYFMFKS